MDPELQRQLELEAEAEMELEFESAMQRSAPAGNMLGPSYDSSIGGNVFRGAVQAPAAIVHMAGDAYNFANPYANGGQGGPIDTIRNAGAEKTLRTVGGLSAGTAGAMYGAPTGALWGSAFGPLGAAAGGVLGGAAGFGAGLFGFDFLTDASTEAVGNFTGREDMQNQVRPADQYAKDFAYNLGQGTVLGATHTAVLGSKGLPGQGPGPGKQGPWTAPTPGVRGVPKYLYDKVTFPFSQAAADMAVGNKLNEQIPGGYEALNTALADLVKQGVPPELLNTMSTAEILNSPLLKNEQRILAGTSSDAYGRSAEARVSRNDAQLKYLNQIEQGPNTAADAATGIQQGVAADLAAMEFPVSLSEQVVRNATDLIDRKYPTIDAAEGGNTVRAGINENLLGVRGKVTAGFEGAGNAPISPEYVKATLDAELPKYFREVGAQPSGELSALRETLFREGEPVMIGEKPLLDASGNPVMKEVPFTVRDMQAARSQAIKIVQGSDPRSAGVAGKIINAIDESLNDAVNSGQLPPEELESLRSGIAARKTQGTTFEAPRSPTKAILDAQYGNYSVPDSAVLSKYFKPGKKTGAQEAIQNYKAAYGDTPKALEPLHRYAADSFRDAAVGENGLVDARKARSWLKSHAEALKEMPDLERVLSTTERAQEFLNEKYGDLKRSKAEVENGALKFWLKTDKPPEIAIAEMLSGKDAIQRTVRTTEYLKSKGANDAISGLRRGVVEYIQNKVFEAGGVHTIEESAMAGGPRFDGITRDAVLAKTWKQIEPALIKSKLFTDSQMKAFDHLYKNKVSQLSIEKARLPSASNTAADLTSLERLKGFVEGQFLSSIPGLPGSFLKAGIVPILKMTSKAKFIEKMEQAILDPKIARDLMMKATTKNLTKTASQIFKEEISAIRSTQVSPAQAITGAAKIAAPYSPTIQATPQPQRKQQSFVPRQQAITSRKSFPNPNELLRPPAPGFLKKTSVNDLIQNQSAETQARINVESNGDPWATSPKGAQGLSQLMPETAQEIAKELGETYIPLRADMTAAQQAESIAQNIRFGEYYYKKMLGRYKDPVLARAAYNAGPQRMDNAIAMAGTSRDVNRILSVLPKGVQRETIPYVKRITSQVKDRG